MKKLVLLTNRYPYPPGEEFLSTELEVISNQLDDIFIMPSTEPVNFEDHKKIPGNSTLITEHLLSANKALMLIKLLLDPQSLKWLLKESRHSFSHGFKGFMVMVNWLAIATHLKKYLAKRIIHSEANEAIFYSYWLTPSALALAMVKEKHPKIYAVSRVHGGDLYAERHIPAYLPFQNKIIANLNRTFSISSNGKAYLEKRYPKLKGKIEVERLGTLNSSSPVIRKASGAFRIITCSYLKPVKRIQLLVQALVHSKIPIEWTHIGDGPERIRIETAINNLPANVKVNLVGSMANKDILENYRINNYDLFINVSESEGIPVTIMEAFSFGIPVIATDVGGTSELVKPANGDLVPKDFKTGDLMNLIEKYYYMSEEDYLKKSHAAYETWNTNYNAEQNYKMFIGKLLGESLKNEN
jgi:glycosyltransferase involved in cell wall biosynthesis